MRVCVQVSPDTSGSHCTDEQGTNFGVCSVKGSLGAEPIPLAWEVETYAEFSAGGCSVVCDDGCDSGEGSACRSSSWPAIAEGMASFLGGDELNGRAEFAAFFGDKEGKESMRYCVQVSPDTSGSQLTKEQGTKCGGFASVSAFAGAHPAMCHLSEAVPTSAAAPFSSVVMSVGTSAAVLAASSGDKEGEESFRVCVQVSPDTSGSQFTYEQGKNFGEVPAAVVGSGACSGGSRGGLLRGA